MEVGHQQVDDLPVEAAMDEQVGASRRLAAGSSRLQCPHRRGADGDDTAGLLARQPGRLGDVVALGVHRMVERVRRGDRLERVEPDHQLDLGHADAGRSETTEQFVGEVEPGRRRRGAPRDRREHRLVARRVAERRRDVGRQRHLADLVEQRQWVDLVGQQFHVERVAGGRALPHPHDRALAGEEHLSHAESFAGAQQRLPPAAVGGRRFEQQDLRGSSRVTPEPQPSRDDPGLVQHEEIALAQEFRQVADVTMLGRCGATVDQQAGTVARLDRRLGDAIVGQVVVEVGDLHRPEATAATWFVLAPTQTNRERQSNRLAPPERRGTATPMCSYAASSATRPRGVRAIIPWVMRNGSYMSSTVSGCSPTLIATVDRPTGRR